MYDSPCGGFGLIPRTRTYRDPKTATLPRTTIDRIMRKIRARIIAGRSIVWPRMYGERGKRCGRIIIRVSDGIAGNGAVLASAEHKVDVRVIRDTVIFY